MVEGHSGFTALKRRADAGLQFWFLMRKLIQIDVIFDAYRWQDEVFAVRTTVTLDDELLSEAQRYTGIRETGALLRHALSKLVEIEAAQRLARLGGTAPDAWVPNRNRAVSLEPDTRGEVCEDDYQDDSNGSE